ncbi:MAG: hypothetical protein PHE29_05785, partial [Tissierellia bacterium]|nr:hypothetical protein [Tissierellia bacterium]MDD4781150.1 hypothetical protein [Tissierellia bacterium]
IKKHKRHQPIAVSVFHQVVNYILLTFSWFCASLYFKRVALPPQVIGCNLLLMPCCNFNGFM